LRIQDLGVLEGEVLLFGGVYSNLQALEALLEVARLRRIFSQNAICTGDVVAYCADAQACVARIRAFGCPVLAGNCEVQLAADAADCGCGFEPGSACSALSVGWYARANAGISAASRSWMATCPDRIVFEHQNQRFAVLHGGASDISKFIWPVTPDAVIAAELVALTRQLGPVDHVIAGHSGIAMQRRIGRVTWTNAGAIGMPGHHGRPTTSYAILSNKGIEIKVLSYDFNPTIRAMQQAGLTQGYHECLQTGYWPSEDVLPPEMRLRENRKPAAR
jgi:predicted phosphodiesterase